MRINYLKFFFNAERELMGICLDYWISWSAIHVGLELEVEQQRRQSEENENGGELFGVYCAHQSLQSVTASPRVDRQLRLLTAVEEKSRRPLIVRSERCARDRCG